MSQYKLSLQSVVMLSSESCASFSCHATLLLKTDFKSKYVSCNDDDHRTSITEAKEEKVHKE